MRLIHVKLEKIRNSLFIKIPDLVADALHLKDGEDIEISIHSDPVFAQGELWGDEKVEDINDIYLNIFRGLGMRLMLLRVSASRDVVPRNIDDPIVSCYFGFNYVQLNYGIIMFPQV